MDWERKNKKNESMVGRNGSWEKGLCGIGLCGEGESQAWWGVTWEMPITCLPGLILA